MAFIKLNYLDYYLCDAEADKTGNEAAWGNGAQVHVFATNKYYLVTGGAFVATTVPLIPINQGGTGQITANASLNALLPTQTANANKFLQTDGTNTSWVAGNAGTVTSVSFTGGIITVATATTTPALTIAGTSGGIPYFSSTSTWASSALLAANALMIGGGAGTAPSTTTTGTGILTWLGTPSSANLASAVTDETGSGSLVFATSPGFTTAANPISNDGAALGTTALQWSDLFLASGAVVNWANGDMIATHATGSITFAGGSIISSKTAGSALAIGGAGFIYRTTNGGANIAQQTIFNVDNSTSVADSRAYGFDLANGFLFEAANGTRQILRAAMRLVNTVNTAGSEAGDLGFYTQSAGGVVTLKATLTGTGLLGIGLTPTKATLEIKAGTTTIAPIVLTSGTNNSTAQPGAHEYNGNHYLTNANIRFPVGGSLFDHFTDTTVGGAEADIYTDTLAASTLGANGGKVLASYGGNFVTVGTELTQLKVYFAGTAIWDSTGVAPTTGTTSWNVNVRITRVSSTVVRYNVSLNTTGASGFVYDISGELTGLTLSNTNILKITGTSTGVGSGSGDIVGKEGYVEFKPAA